MSSSPPFVLGSSRVQSSTILTGVRGLPQPLQTSAEVAP